MVENFKFLRYIICARPLNTLNRIRTLRTTLRVNGDRKGSVTVHKYSADSKIIRDQKTNAVDLQLLNSCPCSGVRPHPHPTAYYIKQWPMAYRI